MPTAAPKPCTVCRALVLDGGSRCEAHQVRAGAFSDRQRGSRHERGYGSEWVRTRKRILARDNGLCQCDECKATDAVRIATQVDHRINKAAWKARHGSMAGVDDDSNLQAINRDCHDAKTKREAAAGRGADREGGLNL